VECLYLNVQSVPRSKQSVWVLKTSVNLCMETSAVCSEVHTKHIIAFFGQNVEFLKGKHGGTYSNHWVLKG
jgi:hypothetical protein